MDSFYYGLKIPPFFVFSYMWAIGSSPNLTIPDIMEWKQFDHWHRSACVDIPLNHSQKYYNYVRAYNQALNSRSTNMTSDGGEVMIENVDEE
jgi:hypothetical protein